MDRLQRTLTLIKEQLGGLGASQKLLLGSLAVIMAMTLLLVTQYTGKADMVPLMPGGEGGEQERMRVALASTGIRAEIGPDGQLMVPSSQQHAAVAALAQGGQLPDDSTILFNNLVDKQGWQISKSQSEQMALIALQNELARVIRGFSDVRDATVIIDAPIPRGLGAAVRTPTASATVFTSGGGTLQQATVDAVASLIAGARSGLDVARVRVIDGSTGRQRRASSEDDIVSSTYMEHANKVEQQTRQKLSELLGYIPGVIVAVTAQVDVTRQSEQLQQFLPTGEGSLSLLASESAQSQSSENRTKGAAPGVQANQTADIRSGGGGGTSQQESDETTSFENYAGSSVKSIVDPRGMPTRVAVSVNIPRGYVVSLMGVAAEEGEEPEPPSDAEVEAKFSEVQPQILASILPHVKTMTTLSGLTEQQVREQVTVGMIPVDAGFVGGGVGTGGSGMLGVGTGTMWAMGDMIDKVVLGVLALVALGMMLMTVKKAGKRVELPSAEELVGLPKTLDTQSDLVGEADEGDSPMAGIEVDDEQVRAVKMLEQVTDMVKEHPDQTARMLSRWVQVEE